MAENKQSNLSASVKMMNVDFKKYIINSGVGVGGYSVLVDYQSLPSNTFLLAPPSYFSV